MLLKIRRLKVKESIDGLFDVGEILYEYYDYPDHFYSLNKKHDDLFNIKTISEYGGFDTWFQELKPIKKEKSPQYKLLNLN